MNNPDLGDVLRELGSSRDAIDKAIAESMRLRQAIITLRDRYRSGEDTVSADTVAADFDALLTDRNIGR